MFPKHKCPTAKSVWNSCTLCLLSGRARWALGFKSSYAALCLVIQSCLTLCDPMDCSPPGSSVYGDSPGKNEGVGCHALLQMKAPKSSQMHVDTHIHTPHCKHNPFYFFRFSCQRIQLSMTLSWINQQSVNWLNNNNKKNIAIQEFPNTDSVASTDAPWGVCLWLWNSVNLTPCLWDGWLLPSSRLLPLDSFETQGKNLGQ